MWRIPVLMVFLVAGVSPAIAQTVDKVKLRAAACLPEVTLAMPCVCSDDLEKRDPDGKPIDLAAKIAALQKRLAGTAQDAEVYLEMARCYGYFKENDKQLQAAREAQRLLGLRLQTTGEGWLLAAYCEMQAMVDPDGLETRMKLARRAVAIAPDEWRCWDQLAAVCALQFCSMLSEDTVKIRTSGPVGDATGLKPTLAVLDAAEKCLQEAQECCGKVLRLADRDPRARVACFYHVQSQAIQQQVLDHLRDLPVDRQLRYNSAVVQDAIALADLCAENMVLQTNAVMRELPFILMKAAFPLPDDPDQAPILQPQDHENLQKYVDRLAKGTQSPHALAAAFCHKSLATVQALLEDLKGAEKHARRSLELDDSAQDTWEVLLYVLTKRAHEPEAQELARKCLKRLPGPRNHFLVAKFLVTGGKLREAEEILRTGLKAAPADAFCTVGLAAVLVLRSDQAGTLTEAGKLLETATQGLGPETRPELRRDLTALRIVVEGLQDRPATGRRLLEELLQQWPETPPLQKLREALGS